MVDQNGAREVDLQRAYDAGYAAGHDAAQEPIWPAPDGVSPEVEAQYAAIGVKMATVANGWADRALAELLRTGAL